MTATFGYTLSPQFQENILQVANMFMNYIMFLTKCYTVALKPQLVFNIVTTMHNTACKKLARNTKCLLWLQEKQLTSKTPVLSVIKIQLKYIHSQRKTRMKCQQMFKLFLILFSGSFQVSNIKLKTFTQVIEPTVP